MKKANKRPPGRRSRRRPAPYLRVAHLPILAHSHLKLAKEKPELDRITRLSQNITQRAPGEGEFQESESLLAQALRLANIGTWEYDVKARDFVWSDDFSRMLGLQPRKKSVSVEESCAFIYPADRARMWSDVASLVTSGKPLENEFEFVRRDGEIRVFHSRAVPVRDSSGVVARIQGMSQDVTKQKTVEDDLHRLSQQLMHLRDHERRRMALQLHETAVQSLAGLKMTLGRLAENLPRWNKPAWALHDSCAVLAEEAIQEVRTVSYLMHPPMLDLAGLRSALRWLAEGFARRSGVTVKVDIDERLGRFPQEIETGVFRIVQEALTNIHRHSGSRRAEIRLRGQGETLHLEIQDHGRGMPVLDSASQKVSAHSGVGITGIRERVEQLQGRFEIQAQIGAGTILRVSLPAKRNHSTEERRRNESPSAGVKLS